MALNNFETPSAPEIKEVPKKTPFEEFKKRVAMGATLTLAALLTACASKKVDLQQETGGDKAKEKYSAEYKLSVHQAKMLSGRLWGHVRKMEKSEFRVQNEEGAELHIEFVEREEGVADVILRGRMESDDEPGTHEQYTFFDKDGDGDLDGLVRHVGLDAEDTTQVSTNRELSQMSAEDAAEIVGANEAGDLSLTTFGPDGVEVVSKTENGKLVQGGLAFGHPDEVATREALQRMFTDALDNTHQAWGSQAQQGKLE